MPKKKTPKKLPSISFKTKLLLALGAFLITIPTIFYTNQTIQLTFFTPRVPSLAKTGSSPVSISVPATNIALPIEEEAIHNNSWGVSTKGASHLTTSANPGEKGPIILYSHNTDDRFGPIRWLTQGKKIEITTADGKKHIYIVAETKIVDPRQTDIFFSRKDETLYLYTCDGFADLQRFVVIALPQKIELPLLLDK